MATRTIAHIDIPAKDREVLSRFYSDLFGWKIQQVGTNHIVFETGNVKGRMPVVDGKVFPTSNPLVYVSSEDIDADMKKAESLGAKKIVGKTELPGIGHFAIFEEPSGHRIGLWKPA